MKIDAINASIIDAPADALIVNLFEGVTAPGGATGAVDKALGGMISELISSGEATGKLMETTLLHTCGRIAPKRVLIIGLGKSRDFDLSAVRKVSGAAVRFLRDKGVKSVTSIVHGAGIGGHDVEAAAQAVVEGTIIGLYRATLYKTNQSPQNELESFAIVEQDASRLPAIENAIHQG
ncbi:MAG TPA: M17 family peptidase N-terminal domain-containing protein, partial [Armatimonadota bacterium]